MRHTKFENHRKNKELHSDLISVITPYGKVESGWTNGRTFQEISDDFGEQNIDWFWFQHSAEAYAHIHKNEYKKEE